MRACRKRSRWAAGRRSRALPQRRDRRRCGARGCQGGAQDFSSFEVLEGGHSRGTVQWSLIGAHNMENALAAIAAARHAGVEVPQAIAALREFKGIARRMQLRGEVGGVRVYDDFAHHPTAIATTLDGLRRRSGAARIIAVLEPRSYTMRMGVHQHTLAPSLAAADQVWLYTPPDLGWDTAAVLRGARQPRPRQRGCGVARRGTGARGTGRR